MTGRVLILVLGLLCPTGVVHANLCVRTALELATQVEPLEAASPGNFVFQIKLPKRTPNGEYQRGENNEILYETINFMNIKMFGYGSASEAGKGRMRHQAEEIREFIESVLVAKLSNLKPQDTSLGEIKRLLTELEMPFDSVSIADEGVISRCVGLACNVIRRAPYTLEQTVESKSLALKFGRYPIKAEKISEMYRDGKQFTRIEKIKAQVSEVTQVMKAR